MLEVDRVWLINLSPASQTVENGTAGGRCRWTGITRRGLPMSEKSAPPIKATPMLALVDRQTMAEVEQLAARYGVEPEEVLIELIKMDLEERPESATLH
jgi:hypothetical protein